MFQYAKKVLYAILICGVLLALLRAFGYDPLLVIQWLWSWFWNGVLHVADFLTGNIVFNKLVSSPSTIVLPF